MMASFADYADLPENVEIEVHQMRIIAKSAAEAAVATPEGVHQDGFDRTSACLPLPATMPMVASFIYGKTKTITKP